MTAENPGVSDDITPTERHEIAELQFSRSVTEAVLAIPEIRSALAIKAALDAFKVPTLTELTFIDGCETNSIELDAMEWVLARLRAAGEVTP